MSTFNKHLMIFVENLAGPLDWYQESGNAQTTFKGRFLIYDRAGNLKDHVRGMIVQRDQHVAEVYLYDPPLYISKHRHGRCMQLLTPDSKWFKLHFEKPATNFGDAYMFVEAMLTEAFNLTH
ncbi:MAG: hypothetical protein IPM59_03515 [Chloracidobacterium sp.]|nr:hypothetical protein [Chloracidobacterium sp.]